MNKTIDLSFIVCMANISSFLFFWLRFFVLSTESLKSDNPPDSRSHYLNQKNAEKCGTVNFLLITLFEITSFRAIFLLILLLVSTIKLFDHTTYLRNVSKLSALKKCQIYSPTDKTYSPGNTQLCIF